MFCTAKAYRALNAESQKSALYRMRSKIGPVYKYISRPFMYGRVKQM